MASRKTQSNKEVGAKLWRGPVRHIEGKKRQFVWWARCPQCEEVSMIDCAQAQGNIPMTCSNCEWRGWVVNPITPMQVQKAIDRLRKVGD